MRSCDPSLYAAAPCFQVRLRDGQVETKGPRQVSLGHEVPTRSGKGGDGIHADWTWDGRRLIVRGDHFGMYPVYYTGDESGVSVSSSCFKLIAMGASPGLDWPALAVFLRIGCFICEDTPFASIRTLPPHGRLSWQAGKLEISGERDLVRAERVSESAAVDAYIDLFSAAMARRLPGQASMALPLSGGRDSRHILFELCTLGQPPEFCITGRRFPPEQPDDERIAAKVASELDVPHVIVGPPRHHIASLLAANVKTNLSAPRRGWKMSIVEHLSRESIHVAYDGIGGDMLSGGSALTTKRVELMEAGKFEAFCRYVFGNADRNLSAILPRRAFHELRADVAMDHLMPELARHAEAANPTTSFYFWNRTRRFDSTNPYGMLAEIPVVFAPFLDRELVDFLLALPAGVGMERRIHDEAISKAYPRYAHLPFEKSRAQTARNPTRTRAATRELAQLLLRKRPAELLRWAFVLPRLAARSASLGYSTIGAWWVPLVSYLAQLEDIAFNDAIPDESQAQRWEQELQAVEPRYRGSDLPAR